MPAKIKFKKSMLAHCLQSMLNTNDINKLLCASIFLSVFATPSAFAEQSTLPSSIAGPIQSTSNLSDQIVADAVSKVTQKQQLDNLNQQDLSHEQLAGLEKNNKSIQQQNSFDSAVMLQQQEKNPSEIPDFKPIQFDDLASSSITPVDSSLVNEIYQEAEAAKNEAIKFRNNVAITPEKTVTDATYQELTEISQAPVNVDQLMNSIKADSRIVVEANESGKTLADSVFEPANQDKVESNFFKRLLHKVRPPQDNLVAVPRISAVVEGAPGPLANNIKAQLSSFSTESFSDFNSAVPQLRTLTNQAAHAVGYYNAQFKFEKLTPEKVKVSVTPNDPVIVQEQNIEFTGAGKNLAQFQVIRVLPELDVGDILNQGLYEKTKTKIADAATNNGFFDSYWRLHDVKIEQPQNKAFINLKYETGERYKLGEVEFKMSDPTKPLPIDLKILKTLVTWEDGADYTAWRVNGLANNLTNSRYFNYTLVDAVKPDPIQKPLELPPDVQKLVDQQKIDEAAFSNQTEVKKTIDSAQEVTQNVVDEKQFAGTNPAESNPNLRQMSVQQQSKESEEDLLKDQARADKKIPVIVTLNADQLNNLEAGIGYGTDTGVRLRSQYRRAIVNHLGHSFDANMELSQIRQSFDGRYNIPYTHPLNDYISVVGGYEREERDAVGNDLSLVIESAVAGVDRIIKGSRKEWQHIIGVRYRLDRITQQGITDISNIPDAFLIPGAQPQQQSLLLGYETTKTSSDNRLNPTRGFKQSYKVQLGSESLLSDTNMAIANASWNALYSFGENNDYQFVVGADLGYIFTKDFEKVPYNLRFFAGGDQSLRGFDYKSLSPVEYGYKVGGQALAVGSLEYNYQFKEGWRAAVFTDFGNAYDEKFKNGTEYSLGLGVRWKSPIGSIRLDVAAGISDPAHPIRLHFFIGPQL
ncbi:autotransporter assembly complex protein TamA [Acinetobacter sp. ANC 4648]|uniref:autotransporter assembly complex protein TamA n=1 Tax=Acinetobacter sp. ANC 4648 TaxID=1977875 RepID=UPI000A34F4C4|nr:BamA/TamA family outer membrane protein [Acinetobacter sp. ANC 4648]OTG83037.1 hypothetical protein B9T27_07135 [Acinetobacter sp. ANC 4648]